MKPIARVEPGEGMEGTRTYRGRTLEEILPQIKAELGPDAVITRQRDGLMGGVGGFFQRQCIEVVARRADQPPRAEPGGRFDAYDEEPAGEFPDYGGEAVEEGLSSRAIQELLEQASPFTEEAPEVRARDTRDPIAEPEPLAEEEQEVPGSRFVPFAAQLAAAHVPPPAPEPTPPPRAAEVLRDALVDAGIDPALARELVAETVSHALPFGSLRALKRLVRAALARRIPIAPTAPPGARALAFVGPGGAGKTLCTARIAAAYAARSDLPVTCLTLRPQDAGAELRSLLEPAGVGVRAVADGDEARAHRIAAGAGLVVLDTPAVSPGDAAEVATLATEIGRIGLDEVQLALPATFSGAAAAALLERLAALAPNRLALTHLDATPQIGGLVDMVVRGSRPVAYVSSGTGVAGGLEPADAADLAARVLP